MIKKIKNRHGEEQTFDLIDDNTVVWTFDRSHCGFSGEIDNITSIDPSGGVFISVGSIINFSKEIQFKIEKMYITTTGAELKGKKIAKK